ncbi:hypothetical protein [Streptomyces sp. NPDC006879]|uniref:hypothetical protein n=1 Tax=Streptomyces sp. NPDC006879 TaxID=3364767 RepID=UPI0036A47CF5
MLHQGVYLERIRGDRILHEAPTVGTDPLCLAPVFNMSRTAAIRYATIAQNLVAESNPSPGGEAQAPATPSSNGWP